MVGGEFSLRISFVVVRRAVCRYIISTAFASILVWLCARTRNDRSIWRTGKVFRKSLRVSKWWNFSFHRCLIVSLSVYLFVCESLSTVLRPTAARWCWLAFVYVYSTTQHSSWNIFISESMRQRFVLVCAVCSVHEAAKFSQSVSEMAFARSHCRSLSSPSTRINLIFISICARFHHILVSFFLPPPKSRDRFTLFTWKSKCIYCSARAPLTLPFRI